jgi:zinc transport system substrate-binding protein
LTLSLLLWSLACSAPPAEQREATSAVPLPAPEKPSAPLSVVTTSWPADWLVHRLGGPDVTTRQLTPPGEDPPAWQPSPEVIAGLGAADLIVANGAGFEAWMDRSALPESKVVRTARKVETVTLPGVTHRHGSAGEHTHAGVDPHTWSDPAAYAQQAAEVQAALTRLRPERAGDVDQRAAALAADLNALHQALREAARPLTDRPLSASHPAFNYLARATGLKIQSFDFDPEEVPAPESLAAWARWAADQDPPVLLWEAQPTPAVQASFPAKTQHVYLDPLEAPPEGGRYDYLLQARENARRLTQLAEALTPPRSPSP